MNYLLSNPWLRWLIGAHLWCGFLDAFGSKDQNTTMTEYTNSFNQTESTVNSTSDSGNTSISLGQSGGAGDLSGVAGIAIAILGVLAGLFLITK
jgi:hypothetical protein